MSTTVNIDSSFTLYIQSIFQLNGSLIIKSNDAAIIVNKYLREIGVPIGTDKRTWKYYMHLAGEYHSTDKNMVITSIDTLESIVFNKANMAIHKTTAYEYQYGSIYYEELVKRYPLQEDLIRGILYPVDIDKAIDSKELTILYHDEKLVEPMETNLILELQDWLYGYYNSTYNRAYIFSEEMSLHVYLDKVYNLINQAIYNIRLNNVRTNRAHSFHIWSHLASNGGYDTYKEHLTDAQRLFLYRNVEQLQRDAGRNATLDLLIDRFLTARNIPLYTYELSHGLDGYTKGGMKPSIKYRKVVMNPEIATVKANFSLSTYELLSKEVGMARDNGDRLSEDSGLLELRASNTLSDDLYTKVLESEVIDNSASEEITLTTVLLNHWLMWASTGYYNGMVQIDNPFSGELMQMSPLDSYNLNFYFWCKSRGVDVSEVSIPDYAVYDVVNHSTPDMFEHALTFKDLGTIKAADVQAIIDFQPLLIPVSNLTDFTNQCKRVFTSLRNTKAMTDAQEQLTASIDAKRLCSIFVGDVICKGSLTGETYGGLVDRLGYSFDDLTVNDYHLLSKNTITATIGDVLGSGNILVDMQMAMMNIVKSLSSYDLQFISQTSEAPNKNTPFSMPRLYDVVIDMIIGGLDPESPIGIDSEILNVDIHNAGQEIDIKPESSCSTGIDINQIFNYELLYTGDCAFWGEFDAGTATDMAMPVLDIYPANLYLEKVS